MSDFETTGLDELMKYFDKCLSNTTSKTTAHARRMVVRLIGETIVRTPVKTGNLRRSWTADPPIKNGEYIETKMYSDMIYASSINSGGRTPTGGIYRGSHMVDDAITAVDSDINNITGDLIQDIFTL